MQETEDGLSHVDGVLAEEEIIPQVQWQGPRPSGKNSVSGEILLERSGIQGFLR